jgi:hypothetical protein
MRDSGQNWKLIAFLGEVLNQSRKAGDLFQAARFIKVYLTEYSNRRHIA